MTERNLRAIELQMERAVGMPLHYGVMVAIEDALPVVNFARHLTGHGHAPDTDLARQYLRQVRNSFGPYQLVSRAIVALVREGFNIGALSPDELTEADGEILLIACDRLDELGMKEERAAVLVMLSVLAPGGYKRWMPIPDSKPRLDHLSSPENR